MIFNLNKIYQKKAIKQIKHIIRVWGIKIILDVMRIDVIDRRIRIKKHFPHKNTSFLDKLNIILNDTLGKISRI